MMNKILISIIAFITLIISNIVMGEEYLITPKKSEIDFPKPASTFESALSLSRRNLYEKMSIGLPISFISFKNPADQNFLQFNSLLGVKVSQHYQWSLLANFISEISGDWNIFKLKESQLAPKAIAFSQTLHVVEVHAWQKYPMPFSFFNNDDEAMFGFSLGAEYILGNKISTFNAISELGATLGAKAEYFFHINKAYYVCIALSNTIGKSSSTFSDLLSVEASMFF